MKRIIHKSSASVASSGARRVIHSSGHKHIGVKTRIMTEEQKRDCICQFMSDHCPVHSKHRQRIPAPGQDVIR